MKEAEVCPEGNEKSLGAFIKSIISGISSKGLALCIRFFKNVPVHTIEFYGILIASVVTIICTALLFNYKHHLHGKSHHAGHLHVAK